ncbi:TetR/AcrR family transcriptional regulator [Myceligenerans pegani]|uniref:TetR/AcrR family transcriptional regulator n=1 Tax=Myceligenerans pegani TaxID=2776917 RepID=A0ABR9N5G4_9MICO|nr:TetR/AcrR family transcriptional regulator [Myceligenerans sp. TRM 65318]MBE1878421.1 TetR/AcrR family transcriptional regulator [Myceligenerans sp. TRM 65318]MBE3020692.1 TetR/AcrR family transcriptional regulator [Myceligenerans sp. TRM 65318]
MPPTTRELLIGAATDLLDAGGPEAVTLREVGRRAGVSHNAPYKHFASKEALLADVAARELSGLADTVTGLLKDERQGAEVLREVLGAYAAWALAHPARFRLVFGRWSTPFESLAEAAHDARVALTGTVRKAQADGALPEGDSDRLTGLLQAVVHGSVELALDGHLAVGGKWNTDPDGVIDDLLGYLQASVRG